MATTSGMTATPFPSAPVAPVQQPAAAVDPSLQAPASEAPAPQPRAFDVRSLANRACRAIAGCPAYAAVLFAALMYLGIRFREHLPPGHGRMAVAAAFSAVLYLLAVVGSGDPFVASRGISGLMGTADGTGGMPLVARMKAAWFVLYPAIAVGLASVPALRPWPLVAAVSAAIVLPSVVAAKPPS